MPRALCLIRDVPHYRRDAFVAGLREAGFGLVPMVTKPAPEDVLVIWNRYGEFDQEARRFEAAGAAVIVAENGIIGATENEYAKQYDVAGNQLYTLALNYHNGGGRWWIGEPGRWRQQGISIRSWRETDDDGRGHILVLPQRGFGHPKVAPPAGWATARVAKLKQLTHREVRLRPHPGNEPAKRPLADDLHGCWCVVTWGSGAGIKAMCAGVPAYSDWTQWVGFPSALPLSAIGEADAWHWWQGLPLPDDAARRIMLDRLAWCQWSTVEISTGEPFRRLLSVHQAQAQAA